MAANIGSVLLSFDDGPGASTGQPKPPASIQALRSILATLQANGIVAEFYVIGSEVKQFPEGAKLIVHSGHKIQNHTWSHPQLAKLSLAKVREELGDTQRIIREVTGATATKVRPPYGAGGWPGHFDPEIFKVSKELNLTIKNWDVDTEDWRAPRGLKDKLSNIKKQLLAKKTPAKPSDILMHIQSETARDLPYFISQLKSWGFSFARP
jgi:peptidoglycan/xylan/chitin deacetylase (PgdA/CDA1 family)